MMKQHSQLLGDKWDTYENILLDDIDTEIEEYPIYFMKPLHGFQDGGLCRYQAIYQSPSMRYIMRMFQGNPFYREEVMTNKLNSIKHELQSESLVIDLGCGTGDSTWIVHEVLNTSSVIGIDLSPYMIEIANLQYDLNFMHANAARLPFKNNSVDVITSFALFHEMPYRYSLCVLKECDRVLKHGGHICLWDQKITTESAFTQECKAVPSIEPYLNSYSRLNISKWLHSNNYKNIEQTSNRLMQEWYAKKLNF